MPSVSTEISVAVEKNRGKNVGKGAQTRCPDLVVRIVGVKFLLLSVEPQMHRCESV